MESKTILGQTQDNNLCCYTLTIWKNKNLEKSNELLFMAENTMWAQVARDGVFLSHNIYLSLFIAI